MLPSGTSRPRTGAGGSDPRGTRGPPRRCLPRNQGAARLLDGRGRPSDRALALAANDLVRLVPLPVDEVLHVLEVELDRQRQVLGARLELGVADPLDEVVELLAVAPLGLVVADPALDRLGHALGGQAHLEPR